MIGNLETLIFALIFAQCRSTDFFQKCSSNSNAFYWRGCCYVFNQDLLQKDVANLNCTLYGPGHLAFITTPTLAQIAQAFISSVAPMSTYVWIGHEQSAPNSNVWYWVDYSNGKKWKLQPKTTGVPMWNGAEPNGLGTEHGGLFFVHSKSLGNNDPTIALKSLCQYYDIWTAFQGVVMNAKAPADYM